MLPTYSATLRENRIEWTADAPPGLTPDQPVPVHVTLLGASQIDPADRGARMAAALAKLAASSGLAQIADPAAWEREQRDERALPGRES